jgi:membrane protease YdiL (CAAX protease family)
MTLRPTKGVAMNTTTELPAPSSTTTSLTKGTDMTTTVARNLDRPPARAITVTQYSHKAIFAIWAAAALPMATLAWIVAPAIADGNGAESLVRPLIACLTAGLIWQFVLAVALVGYEQRSLRWSRVKEALWLRSPRNPKTGRVGGKTWLIVIPIVVGLGVEEMLSISAPLNRNLGEFLSSDVGKAMFDGSWGWFALTVTMFVFNTALGEELLFRGVLLPRMHGAFGDRDWLANGVLFATYHLHMPWVIPASVLMDPFLIAYPAKRYRSALISIAVHSGQSVLFTLLLLSVVV